MSATTWRGAQPETTSPTAPRRQAEVEAALSPPTWRRAQPGWFKAAWPTRPQARVIVDNDFAGDPDDLFALVHHLLSPEVDIPAIIASHLAPGDQFAPSQSTPRAVEQANKVLRQLGLDEPALVRAGALHGLVDRTTALPSPGSAAIIEAAMTPGPPLYVAAGGGLTDIASAWLAEPAIAQRLTLVWIGGPEYDVPPPAGAGDPEYNLAIDRVAAQVVFNDSDLPIWQIPRNVYRQCLVSQSELIARVLPCGAIGRFLVAALAGVVEMMAQGSPMPRFCPATYALGDQPLVLLTALQTFFEPDAASSDYEIRPAPRFDQAGRMTADGVGRPIRVYRRVDTRLMFEDMFTKLRLWADWQESADERDRRARRPEATPDGTNAITSNGGNQ